MASFLTLSTAVFITFEQIELERSYFDPILMRNKQGQKHGMRSILAHTGSNFGQRRHFAWFQHM